MGIFDDMLPGGKPAPEGPQPAASPEAFQHYVRPSQDWPSSGDAVMGVDSAPVPQAASGRVPGLFDDMLSGSDPSLGEPWDFSKPADEIRSRVAAISDEKSRKAVHDAWADYRIQNSPRGKAEQLLPHPAKGIPIVGNLLDEAVGGIQGGLHKISGGYIGQPYEEAVAYERAKDRATAAKHPILDPVVKAVSGIATLGPALTGSKLLSATTIPGQALQGAAVTAPLLFAEGLASEGTWDERYQRAKDLGALGILLGAGAPVVLGGLGAGIAKGAEITSPAFARLGALLGRARDKAAIRASAGEVAPQSGADAAADQVIANWLSRGNVTVDQLRQRLDDAGEAALYGGSRGSAAGRSAAQDVLAPVDLDPSMQRLASAVGRQNTEADNLARGFQFSRQTGQPSGLDVPGTAGLPMRRALAPVGPDDPPTGQMERVFDAFKRALRIEDDVLHGHGKSAHATERLIVNRARSKSDGSYKDAYRASENYDISPHIAPVIQKWEQAAATLPPAMAKGIRGLLKQYQPDAGIINNLKTFQVAKEVADGIVSKAFKSPTKGNARVAGQLAEIQREFMGAVDDIKPGNIGQFYAKARDEYAGEIKLRDALNLGKDAAKEDSEVAIEQFKNLATASEQKAFRLGYYDGLRLRAMRKKRTHDVTALFDDPRTQEVIEALIPRSKDKGAAFANRPERFGEYLANEKRMVQTRNETLGGSPTTKRQGDDEALDGIQDMIEEAKKSGVPSTTGFIVRVMENVLMKLFGFRADTAASVARKLYTANPVEREMLLANIEQRMGPGRAAQFARLVHDLGVIGAPASSSTAGAAGSSLP